jgi:uncharacterized HAD superfamily protein
MRIAIDLDDTLINFAEQFIKFHNFVFDTYYNFNEFHSFIFSNVWGGTKEDNICEIRNYYGSDHFKNIKPLQGAVDAVSKLAKDNELFIITSRNEEVAELTKKQVRTLFPDVFKEVHFTSHFSLITTPKSKAEVCDALDIDVLIEDSPDYATDCIKDGRRIFLFARPWNIKRDVDKSIIRVNSWKEILEKLQN